MRSAHIMMLYFLAALMTSYQSFAQEIKGDSSKAYFLTVVKRMNGRKVKGTLEGCTDTTLILTERKRNKRNTGQEAQGFHYENIRKVVIKHKPGFTVQSMLLGAGILGATFASYAFSEYILHSEDPDYLGEMTMGEYVTIAAATGAVAGLIVGPIADSGIRKKKFKINGSYTDFRSMCKVTWKYYDENKIPYQDELLIGHEIPGP